MELKTIQRIDLEKTLKEKDPPLSYEIVDECIKRGLGLDEKDFNKLKKMYEEGIYRTWRKTYKILTASGKVLYQVVSTQELSIEAINRIKPPNKETHFFGEMDLNLNLKIDALYKKAFYISECCGYFAERKGRFLTLWGREGEHFILEFGTDKNFYIVKDVRTGKHYIKETLPDYIGYSGGFGF